MVLSRTLERWQVKPGRAWRLVKSIPVCGGDSSIYPAASLMEAVLEVVRRQAPQRHTEHGRGAIGAMRTLCALMGVDADEAINQTEDA